MDPHRFQTITSKYASLQIAVIGDFCLDRYFEIDPALQEISIETNLPVHNVIHTRCSPGAAGTILNNLVALGIGTLYPVGFSGQDAEGHELRLALSSKPGVKLDHFLTTPLRRTFCYTKPLLMHPGQPPEELSRLDFKNWSPTPPNVSQTLANSVQIIANQVDAVIVLDQVDIAETGVITPDVRKALADIACSHPNKFMIADSRRGLRDFPPLSYKMNAQELTAMRKVPADSTIEELKKTTSELAAELHRPAFVTLSERGILGAMPNQPAEHIPCHPILGPIDVVGAGDSVTANLTAASAAGASLLESLELANAAASIVIHQVGTTGTASVPQLKQQLLP
ncbi:MAG: bifunctional heptose 7-phosphate kinase/heptose 1-phosphate adenyltransferase [Limisphaerales bacterium]|jgi:rfaE bifunctional protein kinase chain/domain